MIKTSALLVLVAIGLLVAGVLASSLLMVYVSIGVCAVAALILAVGVLSHWSEIFGRREPRPSGTPESWSAPQVQVSAPVLASAQVAGGQVQGAQAAGTRAPHIPAREDRRSRRGAAAGASARPDEMVTPQAEFAVPGPGDDLWERVEEELGSPGKRDTGALSWPATEVPVVREPADEPGEARGPGTPPAGSGAWIWGQGAGWQPPETPDEAWPPPAAAFAGSPTARTGPATADADGSGAASEQVDRPEQETPGLKSAAPAGAADEAAPESVAEVAEQHPETAPAKRDAWDERPRWVIAVGDAAPARPAPGNAESEPPASERTAAAAEPAAGQPAAGKPEAPEAPEAKAAEPKGAEPKDAEKGAEPKAAEPKGAEPKDAEPNGAEPNGAEPNGAEPNGAEPKGAEPEGAEPEATRPAVAAPAEEPPAEEPPAEEPAAAGPAADGPAEKPAPGRIEVTVVPGVARYHRSGCILIRFLGAGDLEIMTRQEADEAKFAACRACQPDLLEA